LDRNLKRILITIGVLALLGAATGAFLFWSAGPKLTLALRNGSDWTNSAHDLKLGARWGIAGPETSENMRLALGINGLYYYGSGNDFLVGDGEFSDRLSWNLGIYGGMALVGISGLKLNGEYDMQHGNWIARVMLSLSDTFSH
jgi:hypothetical protein